VVQHGLLGISETFGLDDRRSVWAYSGSYPSKSATVTTTSSAVAVTGPQDPQRTA
jgi:hypothetical protein